MKIVIFLGIKTNGDTNPLNQINMENKAYSLAYVKVDNTGKESTHRVIFDSHDDLVRFLHNFHYTCVVKMEFHII